MRHKNYHFFWNRETKCTSDVIVRCTNYIRLCKKLWEPEWRQGVTTRGWGRGRARSRSLFSPKKPCCATDVCSWTLAIWLWGRASWPELLLCQWNASLGFALLRFSAVFSSHRIHLVLLASVTSASWAFDKASRWRHSLNISYEQRDEWDSNPPILLSVGLKTLPLSYLAQGQRDGQDRDPVHIGGW